MRGVVPPTPKRCCRANPRCRTCPFRFAEELRQANALGKSRPDLPAYLAGVPACLHKYEPLLRPRDKTPA
jgi:hypothetical protein